MKNDNNQNKNFSRKPNPKKLLHLVYGRTVIVVLMVLFQLLVLLSIFTFFQNYQRYFYAFFIALSFILVVFIINSKSNPVFKLAWIMPILVFPVFGGLFYLFFSVQSAPKKIDKRMQTIFKSTKPLMPYSKDVAQSLSSTDKHMYNLTKYINDFGGYPTCTNTSVTYFSLGEKKFEAMLTELEKAEKFIFLEYFIIDFGYMWEKTLEILKRKAAEGVDVRVMYDGMCCLALLPFHYPNELKKFGISCKMYAPIRPVLSSYQNNRDHRKILVIDGKVAFNGGVNLADEYINRKQRYGHWKDTAVMLKGDAVNNFTLMFLEMWNITCKQEDDYKKFITPPQPMTTKSEALGFVIPYGDSPLDDYNVGEQVYMDILNTAENYVHIMMPYLILDNEMLNCLKYTAERGVDVKLILPHISDKKSAFALAHTHYPELLQAGIDIYEYTPGFVHAKVFTSDDKKAVVGSINLDYRSLYLHFECATLIYNNPAVFDAEEDFQDTLKKCMKIDLEYYKKLPFFHKLCGFIMKFFAPLM